MKALKLILTSLLLALIFSVSLGEGIAQQSGQGVQFLANSALTPGGVEVTTAGSYHFKVKVIYPDGSPIPDAVVDVEAERNNFEDESTARSITDESGIANISLEWWYDSTGSVTDPVSKDEIYSLWITVNKDNKFGEGFFYQPLPEDDIYTIQISVPPTPKGSRLFSFAIITDNHIGEGVKIGSWYDYDGQGRDDTEVVTCPNGHDPWLKLHAAVDKINAVRSQYDIRFVAVLGDLTDSAERSELRTAKYILDRLSVPYAPLMGNHDVWPYTKKDNWNWAETKDARLFQEIFEPNFNDLQNFFSSWEKQSCDDENCYQNYLFDYEDYRFIVLDFNGRSMAPAGYPGVPADPDLQNTLYWLKTHLDNYDMRKIIVFAHDPATDRNENFEGKYILGKWWAFDTDELDKITGDLKYSDTEVCGKRCYESKIRLWFAGHSHMNKVIRLKNSGGVGPSNNWYLETLSMETEATKDSPTIRIVQIYDNGDITYDTLLEGTVEYDSYCPLCGTVYDSYGGPLTAEVPYLVTCDVVVPEGKTLTIDPGAQVYFKPNYKITAHGTLDAYGNLASPIYLISEDVPHRGMKLMTGLRLQNGGEFKPGQ